MNRYVRGLCVLLVAMMLMTFAGLAASEQDAVVFPLEEKIKVTWWMDFDVKAAFTMTSYEEVAAYKALEEMTNIDIEWLHPPTGQYNDQFNLIVASGDLPDILYYGWTAYPGGPSKAIADGVIINHKPLIEKYAPNLMRMFEQVPIAYKQANTDDGEMFMFPYFDYDLWPRGTETRHSFYTEGHEFRKDWCLALGLEEAKTIDDWTNMLRAFKTRDPNGNGLADEIPWVNNWNSTVPRFLAAWGAFYGFYQIDGVIHYGPFDDVYLDFLMLMNQWYSEGLIDPDYMTTDDPMFRAKVTNNLAGAWYGNLSGVMGALITNMRPDNPEVYITGTTFPNAEGYEAHNFNVSPFFPLEGRGAAITTKCKNPEIAAALLDIGYSDEGDILYNWGIEGESFTVEPDGTFKLTELITNNPDGLALDQALARFTPGANGSVNSCSSFLWHQRVFMPEQQECIGNWAQAHSDRILAPGITHTPEESARLTAILNQINTYVDEMCNKFIIGVEPLSNYDVYLENLKKMGIDEAITIKQAAYDRFLNR